MKSIKTDVLVIGAGAAGLAAAVAAARTGAEVHLIEKNSFPGGRATASAVGTVCGLMLRTHSENRVPAFTGFPQEFAGALQKASGTSFEYNDKGLYYLPYKLKSFIEVSSAFLSNEKIAVHYTTEVFSAEKEGMEISLIYCRSGSEIIVFRAQAVIDCSGISVLSGLLRLRELTSSSYQSAAQVFGLNNVCLTDTLSVDLSIRRALAKQEISNTVRPYLEGLSVIPGSLKDGNLLMKMGLPDKVTDNENDLKAMSDKARSLLPFIVNFLQNNVKAFGKCQLDHIAHETGFRVGKRPVGKTVLTGSDVLSCIKSPRAVARGTWPVEIWKEGHRVEMSCFREDDYYDITLDQIRAADLNNLYFAGRMISADDTAIASARVIGTCLATGYAAGLASSRFIRDRPEEEVLREIRRLMLPDIPVSG